MKTTSEHWVSPHLHLLRVVSTRTTSQKSWWVTFEGEGGAGLWLIMKQTLNNRRGCRARWITIVQGLPARGQRSVPTHRIQRGRVPCRDNKTPEWSCQQGSSAAVQLLYFLLFLLFKETFGANRIQQKIVQRTIRKEADPTERGKRSQTLGRGPSHPRLV